MNDLRSPLSKARGLGSAKHGVTHWLAQRLTAVALVFLSVWFITALMHVARGENFSSLLASPIHAIAFVLFVLIGFYHGTLGMRVVIEDYIHCACMKWTALFTVYAVSTVLSVGVIYGSVYAHVLERAHQVSESEMGNKSCCKKNKKRCHKEGGMQAEESSDAKPCHSKGQMMQGTEEPNESHEPSSTFSE